MQTNKDKAIGLIVSVIDGYNLNNEEIISLNKAIDLLSEQKYKIGSKTISI